MSIKLGMKLILKTNYPPLFLGCFYIQDPLSRFSIGTRLEAVNLLGNIIYIGTVIYINKTTYFRQAPQETGGLRKKAGPFS